MSQTNLTESERAIFYPNQVFDKDGLCMCGSCLDCYPYNFRGMTKPRECVVCNCYNLLEIKIVDNKIYCLDCVKETKKTNKLIAKSCAEGCGTWFLTKNENEMLCEMCKEAYDEEEEEDYEAGECVDCGDFHELSKFEVYNDKLYCGFCFEDIKKEKVVVPLYTKSGCDVKCYYCNGRFPEIALEGVKDEYIHRDCA